MFGKAILAVSIMLVASATPCLAQGGDRAKLDVTQGGTSEEDAACRRDTRKLCRHLKADEGAGAFLSCLQEHRAALSKACYAVLESHGL